MKKSMIILCIIATSIVSYGKSAYTIIDDDAALTGVSNIKALSDRKGIRISFAVIASALENNPNLIDTLRSYQSQGFQIINHSYSHNPELWKGGDIAGMLNDIKLGAAMLDSLGFINTDYVVYPFGRFLPQTRGVLREALQGDARLAFNSRGFYAPMSGFDKLYVPRFPIRKHENISIVKSKIDEAVARNAWIVLMTHSSMSRDFDIEYLEEVIDYLQSLGLECLTVDEAYNKFVRITPQVDDNAEYTGIDDIMVALYMHGWYVAIALVSTFVAISIIWILIRRRKSHKLKK